MTIRRLQHEGRLAGTVVHGSTLDLAGQVADDPSLVPEGQTRLTRCWHRRAAVETKLVDPRWRVEITGIAALP